MGIEGRKIERMIRKSENRCYSKIKALRERERKSKNKKE